MPNEETTTKFKVDISQLKKEFQEAQRHIQLVNSEFKAATAGMDKWANNADGLGAKITQLNKILEDEKSKLKSLEKQYALVVKEQGENSKGAQELMIKINNQRAAIEKVQSSIGYYSDKLNDLTEESKQAESATDKLRSTISQQESDLESLKAKYSSLILEQGKSSQEAKETAAQISKLSSELQQNKTELNNAESAADKFDNTLNDIDDSAKKAGDGFTVMKGALADLLADGIRGTIGALKEFATESDSAYQGFQAQTDVSAKEMKKFKGEMDDLYKNAYGESLQDIGDKMAYVKQVTGEVDPSKIKELTENAIALEDTFGSDFNETVRGVNNLMRHFGISSEEAFDLFAKGSKLGLDYTDELGDNIAEYGGNFEQAGYSAEEYFQLLVNGSQGGAYNLDKVNDSINEVKNRLGDGTIEKNINVFSDGTKKAFKNWQDGKGTMKDVIDSIVGDIDKCTNEQDALTMAQIAFGTMGEDANLKVVKSLKSTGKSFKDVKGTMEDVKKVKYDDVKTQFVTLGRTIQLDVVAPLAKKALPTVKEFVTWSTKHLNEIVPVAKVVGAAIAAIFTVNKVATFINSLKILGTTFGLISTGATGAATATGLLSKAMMALPYVAVIAGIAALAAGLAIYKQKQEEAIEKEYGLSEAQNQSIEAAKNLKAAYDETNKARNDSMQSVNSEYDHLSQLKNEYNTLIDSNGKVKKGYEDRANFILNQLSQALGLERDQILQNVDANGKLGASIDQVIQKKQAEALLSANEAAYTEAIQKRTEALSTYQESLTTLDSAEKKYNDTKAKSNEVMEIYNNMLKSNPEAADAYLQANLGIIEANDKAKESYDKAKKGVKDAEGAYIGYNTTIQNYEGLSAAIISGDTAKIEDALQNMQNGFITAENGTRTSLEKQVSNMKKTYEDLKAAVEAGTPGVTQAQVDAAKQMVDKAEQELGKLPPKAKAKGEETGKAHADGVKSKSGDNETAGKELSDSANKGMGTANTKKTGTQKGKDFKEGIESKKKDSNTSGKTLATFANKGLLSANTKKTGTQKGADFKSGLGSINPYSTGQTVAGKAKTGLGSVSTTSTGKSKGTEFNTGLKSVDAQSAGKKVAKDAKKGLDTKEVKPNESGKNFAQGFINGIGSLLSKAWEAGKKLAKKASSGLKKGQQEGSPSKLTYKSGKFFVEGYANAISDYAKLAINQAKKLGEESLSGLNEELNGGIDIPALKSNMQMARNAIRNNPTSVQTSGNAPISNTYNFYQTNNSPKALSRLEIYRQTKNQLNFAKGVK